MHKVDTESLRETVLRLTFDRYEGTFAGGQPANNKLDLERIAHVPGLRAQIVYGLAELAQPHRPDLIVGVPHGGDWLATDLAWQLGIRALLLDKDEHKAFHYQKGGEQMVARSERVVGVDDLFNRRTSIRKVQALNGLAERMVAAVAVWDRNPAMKPRLPLPHEALIEEAIPDMLPADDPRQKYLS
ncbi:MAG TPA: hypothetical protein VHC21_01700 [Candidatus Saccharimonadales bacterium]|nr:hypothetical protein [Candidatus Saccharimonadales bacterium]